jgi:DNA invertase Pin-like site-specific DNA recombinase
MKTVAYLLASKNRLEIQKQKQAISEFAKRKQMSISRFIEIPIASIDQKNPSKRNRLLHHVESGDTLIVSQLSDVGWSLAEIVKTVDTLVNKQVRFVAIREAMDLNGEPCVTSQVMAEMFRVLAEIGQDTNWFFSIPKKRWLSPGEGGESVDVALLSIESNKRLR